MRDEGLDLCGEVLDVAIVGPSLLDFVYGAREEVERADCGMRREIRGADLATGDGENERVINDAKWYAPVKEDAGEVSVTATGAEGGARQAHVVRDDGIDVRLPGGSHDFAFFFRRTAASF